MPRLRALLTAAVTYLVALAAIIVIVISELGAVAGVPPAVVHVLGVALTVIGVAIAIIRRVTPVLPAARGLVNFPTESKTQREAELLDDVRKLVGRFPTSRRPTAHDSAVDSTLAGDPGEFA